MGDPLALDLHHRGFKPPPLGGLFLGWGLNPLPKNGSTQLSQVNCQLLNQAENVRPQDYN